MLREHETLPLGELVASLQGLCSAGRTGTIFIHTDCNHSARVVIDQGRICFVAFGRSRGLEAIEQLRQVRFCKFSLTEAISSGKGDFPLPGTDEILEQLAWTVLAGSELSVSEPPPVSVSRETPRHLSGSVNAARARPDPETADMPIVGQSSHADKDILLSDTRLPGAPPSARPDRDGVELAETGEALVALVMESLARSIGPIAMMVCEDYRDQLETLETVEQLKELLPRIAADTGADVDAARFISHVLATLRG